MTAPLSLTDFEPRIDERFMVAGGVPLRLAEASPLEGSAREGGAFRLEFQGPAEAALPQGIYAFQIGEAAHDIFIVPVGAQAGEIHYEAIFF